jgi:hypothetical protein
MAGARGAAGAGAGQQPQDHDRTRTCALAQAILRQREEEHESNESGFGIDVHAFGPGDAVMLGGVRIAHSRGIVAHSDGDVLLHALVDALLGAAGLGDIGQHFPDSDPRWKGADSARFVAATLELLERQRPARGECGSDAAGRGAEDRALARGDSSATWRACWAAASVREPEGHDHRTPGFHRPQ